MHITPIHTPIVHPNASTLTELLDAHITTWQERQILAITSKVVSLCEGRTRTIADYDKEQLIAEEADYYLPADFSPYGYHFSIINNTLVAAAGIDESNGDNNYLLWPKDPQATANQVRHYLRQRFELQEVGVIITDSISSPFRLGSTGTALSCSGFSALRDYIGTPDLFGRPFSVSRANIAEGLAASAVLTMGEGTEQTPLAVISDVSFVSFCDEDPTSAELAALKVQMEDDLFAPFWQAADWQRGKGRA